PHTERAPEVLPSWWEDGFLLDQSAPVKDVYPNVERSNAPIQGGVEFAGSHRLDGVFMASGGPFRQGFAFGGAKIVDVAPTVLYLMGLPVPDEMDGRVLVEALDEEFVADNPIGWENVTGEARHESGDAGAGEMSFTEDESELIAKR